MWKHTKLFLLYSITKTNYAAKIPSTVQLLKERNKTSHLANCYISSFKLFYLFQARVHSYQRLWCSKKKSFETFTSSSIFSTPPVQRSNSPPREGLTCQFPHSPGTENSQMPEGVEVSIWSAHNLTKSRRKHDTLHNLYFKTFSKKSKAFKNVLTIVIDCIPGKNRFICSRTEQSTVAVAMFSRKLKKIICNLHLHAVIYEKIIRLWETKHLIISFDTQLSGLLKNWVIVIKGFFDISLDMQWSCLNWVMKTKLFSIS